MISRNRSRRSAATQKQGLDKRVAALSRARNKRWKFLLASWREGGFSISRMIRHAREGEASGPRRAHLIEAPPRAPHRQRRHPQFSILSLRNAAPRELSDRMQRHTDAHVSSSFFSIAEEEKGPRAVVWADGVGAQCASEETIYQRPALLQWAMLSTSKAI